MRPARRRACVRLYASSTSLPNSSGPARRLMCLLKLAYRSPDLPVASASFSVEAETVAGLPTVARALDGSLSAEALSDDFELSPTPRSLVTPLPLAHSRDCVSWHAATILRSTFCAWKASHARAS
eukprot:2429424-Pleurochrysis_carterae.AAC.1